MDFQLQQQVSAPFLHQLDIPDFADRWCRARIAALTATQLHRSKRAVSNEGLVSIESTINSPDDLALDSKEKCDSEASKVPTSKAVRPQNFIQIEEEKLKKIDLEDADFLLRKVFDNSRNLALSLAKHFRVSWELSDFAELLPYVGIPCFEAPWRKHQHAYVLERAGCLSVDRETDPLRKKLICSYWREALDGLVMGLGETERLSRHASNGHGDDKCLDVLFNEIPDKIRIAKASDSTSRNSQNFRKLKFGEVSESLSAHFKCLTDQLKKNKVELVLEGVSEGKFYYQLKASEGVLCGAGGKILHDMVKKSCLEFDSRMEPVDASPLAVYGGSS